LFSADGVAVKNELEVLITANQFERAQKKLHYLKGSASMLGMQDLLTAIDQLHTNLQHSSLDQTIYAMFKQQLDSAISATNKIRVALGSDNSKD